VILYSDTGHLSVGHKRFEDAVFNAYYKQCCGTETGTSQNGTIINYGSGTGTRDKIMYLISFI
jgi:hypothetical protein